MSNDAIQVGDEVEITVDISVAGIITIHAGVTGEIKSIVGTTALVKINGLLGISVDVDLDVLVKVS